MVQTPIKAVLYARFSPRPDAATTESIAWQLDYCRVYLGKHGWREKAAFDDPDQSGADEDRPGLWDAVNALSAGDVLLVYKLDRLARDTFLALWIEREVAKRKARIVSATGEGTENTSPEGEMLRTILMAVAKYQRQMTAARTRAAKLYQMKQGKRITCAVGRPFGKEGVNCLPYGWREDPADPARMVKDEAEQETIAVMRRLKGKKRPRGPARIARMLNRLGRLHRGKPWHHQAVTRVLAR